MLTAEEKYRLLLEISEAANSQIEIAAVLEAVVEGLEPAIHVDALAVTTVHGDQLVPHAVYIRGVERRQGDSFADTLERWMRLSGGEFMPKPPGGLPLAGTGTEYVGQAGRALDLRGPGAGDALSRGFAPARGRHPLLRPRPPQGARPVRRLARLLPRHAGPLPAPGGGRLRGARPADRRRHGQRPGLRGDRAAQRPAPRREPGAAPGDRRALDVRGDHRLLAGPARDPRPGRQGRGHRHDGADHRRDRHRQGAGGARHPPPVGPGAPRPGGGQLRRPPRLADRLRAVRPREGGVHRRPAAPRRPLRAGGGRLDLPRRGRRAHRPRSRPRCCACSRRGPSSAWAAASRSPPTPASSRPPTATCRRRWPTGPSAATSSTA